MKIQHLIDEQIDQFSKRFAVRLMELGSVDEVTYQSIVRSEGKSFFNFLSRKLIEALGEELINNFMEDLNYYNPGKPPCTDDSPCGCHFGEMFHADGMCLCDIEKKQRLKLKEILSNIK